MFVPTIKYKRVSPANRNDSTHNNIHSTYGNSTYATGFTEPDRSANGDCKPAEEIINLGSKDDGSEAPECASFKKEDVCAINPETIDEHGIQIDPNDDERIIITLSDGKKYTADRYCPHAGADLSLHGNISENEYGPEIGPILTCSIHYWEFALNREGRSGRGIATINACPTSCSKITKELAW
ncbi:hypothetical protein EC973_006511 [Apophysomyces ossiformis]|uniref:Rieske domain-containing protein n=1 Tax=Apophysomyces ossiformis TaxID=679940 RepID=A0A8H7BNF7_9FUNG|nr:hypothetical protein EC973_006511 [Apophysomyces ossiformis]